jgi:hypothetical protein
MTRPLCVTLDTFALMLSISAIPVPQGPGGFLDIIFATLLLRALTPKSRHG